MSEDVDVEKIQVSNTVSSCRINYKHFICYKDDEDDKIKPLHIMLPKTSAYVKSYDRETKWIYLFNEDEELLETYNGICLKKKKELECKPI